MNAERRKTIDQIVESLREPLTDTENVKEEEEEYLESMPENMKDGDKGSAAQESIDNLDSAYNSIQEAIDYLESAKGV